MAGLPKLWKHKAAVWSLAGARVLIPILACVVTGVLDAEIRPPASEISAYFGTPYLLRRVLLALCLARWGMHVVPCVARAKAS